MKALYFLRTERNYQALLAWLGHNWKACADQGHPMAVEIKPEGSKRSLQALRYYWQLMHQVEEKAWVEGRQYAAKTWHDYAKRKFIGVIDMPGGGTMAMSSADLNTKEFNEYTKKVEAWAATELGVVFEEAA